MVSRNHKLTAKMEHFAQLLFQGYSQSTSYKLAYPAQARQRLGTLYPNASRLAADSKVKARLAELRAAEWLRRLSWMPYNVRNSGHTSSVMTVRIPRDRLRASELLGKAQGDFIERTENKNLNLNAQLDHLEVLTDDQIDELLAIVEDKKKALLEGAG
jgi:hypothetical protein